MRLLTHEEVIGLRYIPTHSKELHKIVKLSVYVTTYLRIAAVSHTVQTCSALRSPRAYRHRRIYSDHVTLLYKQLSRFVA